MHAFGVDDVASISPYSLFLKHRSQGGSLLPSAVGLFLGSAEALGWRSDQVEVIDEDQGQSGASAGGREDFSGWSWRWEWERWERSWVWK